MTSTARRCFALDAGLWVVVSTGTSVQPFSCIERQEPHLNKVWLSLLLVLALAIEELRRERPLGRPQSRLRCLSHGCKGLCCEEKVPSRWTCTQGCVPRRCRVAEQPSVLVFHNPQACPYLSTQTIWVFRRTRRWRKTERSVQASVTIHLPCQGLNKGWRSRPAVAGTHSWVLVLELDRTRGLSRRGIGSTRPTHRGNVPKALAKGTPFFGARHRVGGKAQGSYPGRRGTRGTLAKSQVKSNETQRQRTKDATSCGGPVGPKAATSCPEN